MKEGGRKFRRNSSGQLLIVAALAIAMIISSTTIYVYELSKETNSTHASPSISNFIIALKQNTKNTMIGSLANISNGGEKSSLTANLDELSQVFRSLNHFEICQLDFTVLNGSNYDSGIWLSWNTSDLGVSSAYLDFALKVYSTTANVTARYAVNITTTVSISGSYTELVGNEKLVNLTCKIYNEGEPALAKNISLFYEKLGTWIPVDSSNNLSINDYGNGTYTISFTADVPSEQAQVSAHVYDLRDVFVQANTTCSQV